MSNAQLETAIEAAWDARDTITPATTGETRDAIMETLNALDGGGLRVAVTVAPDFRFRVAAGDERVVGRHGAVAVEAYDFAEMLLQILRLFALAAFAECDEHFAIRCEDDAGAEVVAAGIGRELTENDLAAG